jgi:hypothetical protein
MIAGLAIFIIIMSLVWLLFSDSIIQLWQNYFDNLKLQAHRKLHPPKCSDCKWVAPWINSMGKASPEFDGCTNPKTTYSYADSERKQRDSKCGFSGKLFEEKT